MTQAKDRENKKIVVVLGSGRSGTSLLMSILQKLGMRVSDAQIPATISNPEGANEDRTILNLQRELLRQLTAPQLGIGYSLPLLNDWEKSQSALNTKKKLEEVLLQEVDRDSAIWGFKDPQTNELLPLWTRIFNLKRITPVFFLTVRDPVATLNSFNINYGENSALNEIIWLKRNISALRHTSANCFILHYESWFNNPQKTIRDIADYSGLSETFNGDFDDIVAGYIKPSLNRAQFSAPNIDNIFISRLYELLRQCHGAHFDRFSLMALVDEIECAFNAFRGWAESTRSLASLRAELDREIRKQKEDIGNLQKKVNALTKSNKRLQSTASEIDILSLVLENLQK